MFNQFYRFDYLGSENTMEANPIRIIRYRFAAKYRRYLVTFEVYDFDIIAVKYCGMDDRYSANRFEKIYNDSDAFRVISTCLSIMRVYWKQNPAVSFAFYAIPRKWKENFPEMPEKFVERYKKVRFNIYKYAMINLFSPQYFIQLRDPKNSFYVLLNRKQKRPQKTIELLGNYLLKNHDMIFEPED